MDGMYIGGGINAAPVQHTVCSGCGSGTEEIQIRGIFAGLLKSNALCRQKQVICKAVQHMGIVTDHAGQAVQNGFLCIIAHLPDVRGRDVISARHSIFHIEQIVHLIFPVLMLHNPDPRRSALDRTLHPVSPERQFRTCGRVRPLIKNHDLSREIVLVQPRGCFEELQPACRLGDKP